MYVEVHVAVLLDGSPLACSALMTTVSPLTNVFGETVIVQVDALVGMVHAPSDVVPFLMSSNVNVLEVLVSLIFGTTLDSVPPTPSVRGVTAPAVVE